MAQIIGVCLADLWIVAQNFCIEHRRESDPGRIRNECIGRSTIDLVSGIDVGKDSAFQCDDVGQRKPWTVLSKK